MSQPGSNDPLEIAQENDLKSSALTLLNELTYFAVPPSDMTRRDPSRGPQLDPRDLWVKTSTSCHYTPDYLQLLYQFSCIPSNGIGWRIHHLVSLFPSKCSSYDCY